MIIDIIATMEGSEPTMDDLIVALPLAERVPVVALNTLLKHREQIDEDQEVEIQKIHKAYADKIRPLLERVLPLPRRPPNSSGDRTPVPKSSPPSPATSRRGRRWGRRRGR